jgi:aminoglycoside phosphotransferase (APT) family kinase protein
MTVHHVDITQELVVQLIKEQFQMWVNLPVKMVESCGIDNKTFHLGDEMLVRLPSAEGYAAQVQKEQTWLPRLAMGLSTQIPVPMAMGQPSNLYPWHWSVYQWITGESLNLIETGTLDLESLAVKLAKFLNELRQVDTQHAPRAGAHNYYRGAHPSVYDKETQSAITTLKKLINADKAHAVWCDALRSEWSKSPVWVHGDFSVGNILIKNHDVTAVIDFGCMGIGDPACDLVIAWTLFKGKSRDIFRKQIELDNDTWARARGWALWKACITLIGLEDKNSIEAIKQQGMIHELLYEY